MVQISRFRRFQAIIFDFDGVLADSESMQAHAWSIVAAALGRTDRPITIAQIAGRIDRELAGELFPGCDTAWCVNEKSRIEREMESRGELRAIAGAERLVRSLKDSHRLAICSSCHQELLLRRVAMLGLQNAFNAIVGRSESLRQKPAPDLYRRVLALLGVGANDACAIEDSPTGIAAAKAAGVHAIQLLHPGMPRAANADEWIDRFES